MRHGSVEGVRLSIDILLLRLTVNAFSKHLGRCHHIHQRIQSRCRIAASNVGLSAVGQISRLLQSFVEAREKQFHARSVHLGKGEYHIGTVKSSGAPKPIIHETACTNLLITGSGTVDAIYRNATIEPRLRRLLVACVIYGKCCRRVRHTDTVGTVNAGIACSDIFLVAVIAYSHAAVHRRNHPHQIGIVPSETLGRAQCAVAVEGEIFRRTLKSGATVIWNGGITDDTVELSFLGRKRIRAGQSASGGSHVFVIHGCRRGVERLHSVLPQCLHSEEINLVCRQPRYEGLLHVDGNPTQHGEILTVFRLLQHKPRHTFRVA